MTIFGELLSIKQIFSLKAITIKYISILLLLGGVIYLVAPPFLRFNKSMDTLVAGQKQLHQEIKDIHIDKIIFNIFSHIIIERIINYLFIYSINNII